MYIYNSKIYCVLSLSLSLDLTLNTYRIHKIFKLTCTNLLFTCALPTCTIFTCTQWYLRVRRS